MSPTSAPARVKPAGIRAKCDLQLVTVIIDETDAKAQAKFEQLKSYSSYHGSLVFMSGWSGIDFGQYAPTDVVKHIDTNAVAIAGRASFGR